MANEVDGAGNADAQRKVWLICLALVALTLAVFGRTAADEFISLDDDVFVWNNPNVTNGLSFAGVAHVFAHGDKFIWDPMTTVSHMADYQVYGLHAGGHHLTNVLLHALAAALLFLALRRMTGALWPSAVVAALFAIHPMRVESVAWVTERKDVLSGVFFMLVLWAYARYANLSKVQSPKSKVFYVLALLCFGLGLMSKAMLVTVPMLLLVLDWWPLNRFERPNASGEGGWWGRLPAFWRLVVEKVPLLMLSVAAGVIELLALAPAKAGAAHVKFPMSLRLENALNSTIIYVWKMIFPTRLAVFYPHATHDLPAGQVLMLGTTLAVISMVAFTCWRRYPYVTAGWLWYLIMVGPVLGVVRLGAEAWADRYTYLPHIGLYFALTWLVLEVVPANWRLRRVWLASGAVAVIAVLAVLAFVQTGYWRDSETLWKRALAVTSDNYLAEYNYGMILIQQGQVDAGKGHLQRAVAIQPAYSDAHNNLGSVYLQQGRLDDAIAEYEAAEKLDPTDSMIQYNLGVACFQTGRTNEAVAHFAETVALEPDDAVAQDSLGKLLFQGGKVDEAVAHLQKALALQPGLAQAQTDLGWVAWSLATSPDAAQRNGARAVPLADEVVRLSGGRNAGFLFTLAAAEAEAGRFDDAVAMAGRAQQVAREQGNASLAQFLGAQAELFKQSKPYRESNPTNGNAVH